MPLPPDPHLGAPIARPDIRPYHLLLRSPWVSSRGSTRGRDGWLVRLTDIDGLRGLGDCAPLPEAGTEQPAAALTRLQSALDPLRGLTPREALDRLPPWPDTPAARCALETALLDLCARQAQRPLALWLSPQARPSMAVNAALGHLDRISDAQVLDSLSQGYSLIKIKLGSANPESSLARLGDLARMLPPGARLRLDANGAWDPVLAQRMLDGLSGLPIEALEEPLARPDPPRLAALQARVPWPLALDESLAGPGRDKWLTHPPVRRLVLKPCVLGGLLPSLQLARHARAIGLETVVTSTLESGIGLWAAVHLAAALETDLAHGLGTATWLQEPGDAPLPEGGRISLTPGHGLGIGTD